MLTLVTNSLWKPLRSGKAWGAGGGKSIVRSLEDDGSTNVTKLVGVEMVGIRVCGVEEDDDDALG
jgi:hypothetical protein